MTIKNSTIRATALALLGSVVNSDNAENFLASVLEGQSPRAALKELRQAQSQSNGSSAPTTLSRSQVIKGLSALLPADNQASPFVLRDVKRLIPKPQRTPRDVKRKGTKKSRRASK